MFGGEGLALSFPLQLQGVQGLMRMVGLRASRVRRIPPSEAWSITVACVRSSTQHSLTPPATPLSGSDSLTCWAGGRCEGQSPPN